MAILFFISKSIDSTGTCKFSIFPIRAYVRKVYILTLLTVF
ncbi:hypothetical protein D1AOALGA4SA_6683 [Olavius algarvensis Delta 1 endosymbiont]|nr:hypothetical protein D1AOALGA4SA_6683 [Olavius algarvensis Delta 1 endosymbiont]